MTSDQSVIAFNVYDRAQDQAFLGMVEIKPTLMHEHTVDQWHKSVSFIRFVGFLFCDYHSRSMSRLRPYENEVVTGEIRIQITYEQFKVSLPYPSFFFSFRCTHLN